jgi:hypothetical protein
MARVAELEAINRAAAERKQRKKKLRQQGEGLSRVELDDEVAQRDDAEAQVGADGRPEGVQADARGERVPRCGRCGDGGHSKRTCTKDAAGSGD